MDIHKKQLKEVITENLPNIDRLQTQIINRMFYGGNSPPFLYTLLAFSMSGLKLKLWIK